MEMKGEVEPAKPGQIAGNLANKPEVGYFLFCSNM